MNLKLNIVKKKNDFLKGKKRFNQMSLTVSAIASWEGNKKIKRKCNFTAVLLLCLLSLLFYFFFVTCSGNNNFSFTFNIENAVSSVCVVLLETAHMFNTSDQLFLNNLLPSSLRIFNSFWYMRKLLNFNKFKVEIFHPYQLL